MDPTGFAIGAPDVAGMVSGCIDAFEIFKPSYDYDQQQKKLFTRLEIERCRLLICAETIGLLSRSKTSKPTFCSETRVMYLIYRSLKKIIALFSVSGSLNEFGCRALIPSQALSSEASDLLALRACLCRAVSDPHPYTSEFRTFVRQRWIIHDGKKFPDLLDELQYFVRKILQITQKTAPIAAQFVILAARIQTVEDPGTQNLIRDACRDIYPALFPPVTGGKESEPHQRHSRPSIEGNHPNDQGPRSCQRPGRCSLVEMIQDVRVADDGGADTRRRSTWR